MTNEAPLPDEVEKAVTAFNFCISRIKDGCLWSTGSLDRPHITTKNLKDVMAHITALEAENKRMVEALRFYGDKDKYFCKSEPLGCGCCSDIKEPSILDDEGAVARTALAQTGEKP